MMMMHMLQPGRKFASLSCDFLSGADYGRLRDIFNKSLQEDSSSLSVSPQSISFLHAHETDLIPDPRFADVQRAAQAQTHTHIAAACLPHTRSPAALCRQTSRSSPVEQLRDGSTASLYGEKKQGSGSQSLARRSMTHTQLQYTERVGQGQVVASPLTWSQAQKHTAVSKRQSVFLLMVLVFRRR